MIPETARARFNIRFNVAHSGASLTDWVEGILADARESFAGSVEIDIRISGESFLTPIGWNLGCAFHYQLRARC